MWKTLIVLAMVGCGDPEPLDPLGVWNMTGTWHTGDFGVYDCGSTGTTIEVVTVVDRGGQYAVTAPGYPGATDMYATFTCDPDLCTMVFHVAGSVEAGNYTVDYTVAFDSDNKITGSGISQLTNPSNVTCKQNIDLAGTKS